MVRGNHRLRRFSASTNSAGSANNEGLGHAAGQPLVTCPLSAPATSSRQRSLMRLQNRFEAPMPAQIDVASRPRLITLDRLITLGIAAGFVGVQGTGTVFLGWVALHLLQ